MCNKVAEIKRKTNCKTNFQWVVNRKANLHENTFDCTGFNQAFDSLVEPADFFEYFLTDSMIDYLTNQSKSYFQNRKNETNSKTIFKYLYTCLKCILLDKEKIYRPPGRPANKSDLNISNSLNESAQNFSDNDDIGLEIRNTIGLLLYFGIVQLDNIKDYWSAVHGIDLPSKTMSRNRFLFLIRNLHFRDNDSVSVEEKAGLLSCDNRHKK